MKKILSLIAMLVMAMTASAAFQITKAEGWLESLYAQFDLYDGAETYNVYVKGGQYSDYTKIDRELVRDYGTYGRADMIGLKAGTYSVKIVPVVDGAEVSTVAEKTGLEVKNYTREGFAFKNGYSPGAYNADGTLKNGAKVFYVTKKTAKTITMNVAGAETNPCVGLQAIITGYEKGGETTPLAFRFIGLVDVSDLDALGSKEEGIQVKGKKADSELNMTFEGIGDDATIRGFGFLVRNSKGVEFRNFGIMRCMDDAISMDTDNSNIWVHNMDIFYGKHGSGDHVKGDGTVDVKSDSKYVTVSYNHFWDTGKTNMFGMKSESGPNYISYDHNWFDHSDSRHPRVRTMTVHVWNNYFDNVAKYGVGATTGASVFVESNYFLKTKKPILSSLQGTDGLGDGTFSGENGGMIKAYGNYFDKTIAHYSYYTQKNPASTGYDAYEVTNRNDNVPSTEKTVHGGTTYNNFDIDASLMYSYSPVSAEEVPALVKGMYGAGRMNHGDFTYTFKDNVGSDDDDSAYDTALGAKLDNYSTSFVKIFGDSNDGGGEGGDDPTPTPDPTPDPTPAAEGDVWILGDNVPSGYKVDGSASVTKYTYSSDIVKSSNLFVAEAAQHTVTIPAGYKVTSATLYAVNDNNSDNKGKITEIAGENFNVNLKSRKGSSLAEATASGISVTGSLTFTITYRSGVKLLLNVVSDSATAIEQVANVHEAEVSVTKKAIIDGKLVIIKDGKFYNAAGAQIK